MTTGPTPNNRCSAKGTFTDCFAGYVTTANLPSPGAAVWLRGCIAGVDGKPGRCLCDVESPDASAGNLISLWKFANNNPAYDAARIINTCMQGMRAEHNDATPGSARLDLPFILPNGQFTDPNAVFYLSTVLKVSSGIVLRTQDGVPGMGTSCYHVVGEPNEGTRNTAVPCVTLKAANVIFKEPNLSFDKATYPLAYPGGMVELGDAQTRSLTQYAGIENLILDGSSDARAQALPENCGDNSYFNGTQNLSVLNCADCSIKGIASIKSACVVSVYLNMRRGAIQYSTVADSGRYEQRSSDGMTGHVNTTNISFNVFRDATDGNSFFSAPHLYYAFNHIYVTSKGRQHSGVNFNCQPGSLFGDTAGDFTDMSIIETMISTTFSTVANDPVGWNWRGTFTGMLFGMDPWFSEKCISNFTGTRISGTQISGPKWAFGFAGVGDTTLTSSPTLGMPLICNGRYDASGKCSGPSLISLTSNNQPVIWGPKTLSFGQNAQVGYCHTSKNPATIWSGDLSSGVIDYGGNTNAITTAVPCSAAPESY